MNSIQAQKAPNFTPEHATIYAQAASIAVQHRCTARLTAALITMAIEAVQSAHRNVVEISNSRLAAMLDEKFGLQQTKSSASKILAQLEKKGIIHQTHTLQDGSRRYLMEFLDAAQVEQQPTPPSPTPPAASPGPISWAEKAKRMASLGLSDDESTLLACLSPKENDSAAGYYLLAASDLLAECAREILQSFGVDIEVSSQTPPRVDKCLKSKDIQKMTREDEKPKTTKNQAVQKKRPSANPLCAPPARPLKQATRELLEAIDEIIGNATIADPKEMKKWILFQLFHGKSEKGPLKAPLNGIVSMLRTRKFRKPYHYNEDAAIAVLEVAQQQSNPPGVTIW